MKDKSVGNILKVDIDCYSYVLLLLKNYNVR